MDGYSKSSFACQVWCTLVAIQNDARLDLGLLGMMLASW